MAAQFLAEKGIDLDVIISKYQPNRGQTSETSRFEVRPVLKIIDVRLPKRPASSHWDISISNGTISSIEPHDETQGQKIAHIPGVINGYGGLLTPSFCHAHVHLDKCFLLQDEKYQDLEIVQGDFSEAMQITGEAKKRFEQDDLLRRGSRLVEESIASGVTTMRAFVEVDEIVELKCIDAALMLKEKYRDVCHLQICAFAQLALFSGEDGGSKRRELLSEALTRPDVEVIGSTPYVEDDEDKMKENVRWSIGKALECGKFLDFHLDYNLDAEIEPLVWFVLEELKRQEWSIKTEKAEICLGHCTRLTLFNQSQWIKLKESLEDLSIAFVGLPTSDLFMMGRPEEKYSGGGTRVRGTLQIPQMIKQYGLDGAISINNVGNAFTPYGSCSPLSLASLGVGIYQAGTKQDSEILFETISERPTKAIGCPCATLDMQVGQNANLLLFTDTSQASNQITIFGLVHQGWDLHSRHRIGSGLEVIYQGKKVEV